VFIQTKKKEDRMQIVKSKKLLQKLDKTSTEIFYESILDHYCNRPDALEDLCLAEFCAMYTFHKQKPSEKADKPEFDEEAALDEDDNENSHSLSVYELKEDTGFIKLRRRARIIRYRKFNRHTDPDEFLRETIMLFKPYRIEKNDILDHHHATLYLANKEVIERNARKFDPLNMGDQLDDLLQQAEEEEEFGVPEIVIDEDFAIQTASRCKTGGTTSAKSNSAGAPKFNIPNLVSDEELLQHTRGLNDKQQVTMF
jgi:hypothetical protein